MTCASLTRHAKQRLNQRTSLHEDAFLRMLDRNFTVSVGVEPYTRRRHCLFYSDTDAGHFVAIQDFETGEVVTVLPIDYYENLASKISEKNRRKAIWLHQRSVPKNHNTSRPGSALGCKCCVSGMFFVDEMRSINVALGSHRFVKMPESAEDALSDEVFIGKLLAKIGRKSLRLENLELILVFDNISGALCKIPWSAIHDFAREAETA